RYEWLNGPVPVAELPLFPARLLEETPTRTITPLVCPTREALVRWIGKVEAHSGSGGHGQAWRVALRIASQVEDIREGLAIFMAWSTTNCFPPFSERECRHKIEDAYKKRRLR